jgi:hypothetical protein
VKESRTVFQLWEGVIGWRTRALDEVKEGIVLFLDRDVVYKTAIYKSPPALSFLLFILLCNLYSMKI